VRRALETLSPEHREALELACTQDLPYGEIARILDCPVNTVKTRVYYARQHLRRALAEQR
jgi:RNA polymerase sigma-70 factor (ECF subfamily)